MADQQDRGLFGMFGKKHEEGSHGQPGPYTEQGYGYGKTELHHASPQGYTYEGAQNHHAPPTATYCEETTYGIAKPHDIHREEKSHGLLGKLHHKHSDSSSSSSSDEEDKEGGGRKKKGLKEKIKEKLPGHRRNKNEEGEKYASEEKKHGLFGH
ncbi:hypothetical protein SUGI_0339140 [Cryptomeria japonica]|uniref:dehydrin Rab16D n=1 Tax=Cryptomeria japonica TaxID=3369 RepID=UPI0024089930|nr:dehydrin Rab16D [Cryptomeria japonica]GLJ18963.1 hypothetical protein SUGI_0339140 [Cryptomeria japonica]